MSSSEKITPGREFIGSATTTAPAERSLNDETDMQPYFVVVEDNLATEAVHPEVHYIFSDDDDETVLNAALHAAGDSASSPKPGRTGHRVVIVDMDADMRTIARISSLDEHWQVATAAVGPAPSWHGTDSKNMMMRISGAVADAANKPVITTSTSLSELVSMLDMELSSLEPHLKQAVDTDAAHGD